MYLVAYDVDVSDQLTANSFFAGLNDDKELVFGIGNSAPTWSVSLCFILWIVCKLDIQQYIDIHRI